MTKTITRPATVHVMRRPTSSIAHVFRDQGAASICRHVKAGGPLIQVEDGTATCTPCVDAVTADELAALILMERRAGRPRPKREEVEEAALTLIAAGLIDPACSQVSLFLTDPDSNEVF